MPVKPALVVRLLGAPQWCRDDGAARALADKDAALLAKLALDGPQPRQALCELIWPASGVANGALNLRQRAARLHAAAGAQLIELGSAVALAAGLRIDVGAIERLDDETLLASPGLLAGVDLGDHSELDRWIAEARRRVAERCAGVLGPRADRLEQRGLLAEALRLARRVVDWMPLAEQGWRRLMRLHYLSGDRAAAQETYWRLHALLRDELGVRPSAETQQLAQTLEAAGAPPTPLPNQPVPVSLLRPPVLVGRHAAWAEMAAAWERAQAFLLVGDAGLGKSRLLEAFAQGREGLLSERARPGDEQSPNAVLARVLLQIDRRWAPPGLAAERAELARIAPEFGTPPPAQANAAVLRRAVEALLAAAMGRGLRAIVIDDLHNADQATLESLRWLAASPALESLRIGLASRPWPARHGSGMLDAWLTDSQRPARVELRPLTPAQVRELLASLALPALLDERLCAHLYRHAGGHPLYTLATLQDAIARGVGLSDPEALQPPPSVHALLDARIRDLPRDTRALLEVAAVGGADLTVERAARLLDCTPLELSTAWAELEAANVLRAEAFSHDLVHDAALRSVAEGWRQSLHRRWAELLEAEAGVPAARVAAHWESGLRWAEAGRAWFRAGHAARLAGQLSEQTALFENAARCHRQSGDRSARFEALLARLEGVHLREGGAAALDALPEVEELADTTSQRARCSIERIEALLEQGQAGPAAEEAQRVLALSPPHAELAARLRAQLAMALAQGGSPDEAQAQAAQAVREAREVNQPRLVLTATNALMYVHWSAGRLADAVAAQREELACAEALGDRALMVASQVSLAALLAGVGDVPSTLVHARRARSRQRSLGLADNSTALVLNNTVLGAAAAAQGLFDEALEALQEAVQRAGAEAPAAARAKAALALAAVWLLLGRADEAREALAQVPRDGVVPGMQMQTLWMLARAAEMEGASADEHWKRFDDLVSAHGELPLVLGVEFERTYRGAAPAAIERAQRVRSQAAALGLDGSARALAWRELSRWLEVPGAAATEAALALARALEPHAATGLSAKCYPPETWWTLAQAFARGGEGAHEQDCVRLAREWVQAAGARMAPALRQAYTWHNAVNRAVLAWQR